MYTRNHYKPYESGFPLAKSKSTSDFYLRASERSLNYHPHPQKSSEECLACMHEEQRSAVKGKNVMKTVMGNANRLIPQTAKEQYYKLEDNELANLKKSKRFVEQLLEKSKSDLRKNIQQYEQKLTSVTEELQAKTQALIQLQKSYNQLQAQQQYQVNASLVRSYKQLGLPGEEQDQLKARKIKQLIRRNSQLEEDLAHAQTLIAAQNQKLKVLEGRLARMGEFQREYEAMRALINKMQIQKLELLDRQQDQLQKLQSHHRQEMQSQQQKIYDLKVSLDSKSKALDGLDKEMQQIKTEFAAFKNEQFQYLRQLLDDKERDCLALQSKISCIESELNFLKGRYGYILKLARSAEMGTDLDGEEYCLQRVNRYNVQSENYNRQSGRESLVSMNLSPIRRR